MITEIQNTRDIQIIRAVFGNFDFNLIPSSPQFNEVVYVWGIDNKSQLDSMGYTTILCDRNNLNFKYSSVLYFFMHKIFALNKANQSYSKFLFLDWDFILIKNLDDSFFSYLNSSTFLAPIYSYNKSQFNDISIDTNDWTYNKFELLKTFSWETEDMYVIPNAGFIFVNNTNLLNNLSSVVSTNKLKCLIEEYSIFILTNTTLDNYITSFQPKVCDTSNNEWLTTHIQNLIETDFYFKNIV